MIATLLFVGLLSSGMHCLESALPIGEKELLDPPKRWPIMQPVTDSMRTLLLTNFGYADSTGAIPEAVTIFSIVDCGDSTDPFASHLYLVRGTDGDRDENVWLATTSIGRVLSRSLVAQLQTTCSATFLRGCSTKGKGIVDIQQLQHNFDCESEEFIKTDRLPSFQVVINNDGALTEIYPDLEPATSDSTQTPD